MRVIIGLYYACSYRIFTMVLWVIFRLYVYACHNGCAGNILGGK